MSNVYRYRWGDYNPGKIEKTGTVAIESGEMIKVVGTNGRVQAVSASTDATSLLGVAIGASPATDPTATQFSYLPLDGDTVFEFAISSAAKLKFGQPLVISDAETLAVYGTAGTNLNVSSTNVVGYVSESMDETASVCLVRFLSSKYKAQITDQG